MLSYTSTTDVPAYIDTLRTELKCHCKRGVTLTTYGSWVPHGAAADADAKEGVKVVMAHGLSQKPRVPIKSSVLD